MKYPIIILFCLFVAVGNIHAKTSLENIYRDARLLSEEMNSERQRYSSRFVKLEKVSSWEKNTYFEGIVPVHSFTAPIAPKYLNQIISSACTTPEILRLILRYRVVYKLRAETGQVKEIPISRKCAALTNTGQ